MQENKESLSKESKNEKKYSVDFSALNMLYHYSEYGEVLASRIRWGEDKPDGVSDKDWQDILGVDANNFKHLLLSYNLTKLFIEKNETSKKDYLDEETKKEISLTIEEEEDLLITAIVHDWAEAVVGDKKDAKKTKKDEQKEYRILKEEIIERLVRDPILKERMIKIIDDVLLYKTSRLSPMFNAIERVGYFRTGLRAWDKSKFILQDDLKKLAIDVVERHLPKLKEYAEKYPAIKEYLDNQKEVIDEILAFKNK